MFSKLPLVLPLASLVFAAPAPQIVVEGITISFPTVTESSAPESAVDLSSCIAWNTPDAANICNSMAEVNSVTDAIPIQMNAAGCTAVLSGSQYCISSDSSSSAAPISNSVIFATTIVISEPGAPTSSPTSSPKSTGVSGPATTGGLSSCTKFVTATTGDTCSSIAAANRLTASTFMQINPSINADCTNLLAGTQYCVATSSSSTALGASSSRTSSGAETIATSNPIASSSLATSPPPTISTTPTTSTPNPTSNPLSDPDTTRVTNTTAFTSNAGNKNNTNENDGIGAGSDTYICYSGTASAYPDSSKWVSFSDMWNANAPAMLKGCSNLSPPISPNTTTQQLAFIKSGIQAVAEDSLVDHRFILATIMQESIGCVNTRSTTSSGDVNNPGLMQSHNGSSFIGSNATAAEQAASIQQMIIDGTQGTAFGDGQVQGINLFGNVYDAAHFYNSGFDNSVTDLNAAGDATASYVVDIANRLTGWVTASKIPCS